MGHKQGISGSTIYSDPEKFSELFLDGVEHIEIGEFPDEKAMEKFLELCEEKQMCFGIHSPLLRNRSKYDLIEKVNYEPDYAWEQLEVEAKKMSALGAKYLLVHFPYFKGQVSNNTNELIEEGLKKLSSIQKKYSIELICEPKLGINRSSAGLEYLNNFSKETWAKYNIKLCVDIGDYIIGTKDETLNYILKWKEFIKVVHLHNIHYEGNRYIWIPVHPTQEHSGNHKVEQIIRSLSKSKDVTFVFEHTPETNPSKEFVCEGIKWVNSIIKCQARDK